MMHPPASFDLTYNLRHIKYFLKNISKNVEKKLTKSEKESYVCPMNGDNPMNGCLDLTKDF